MNRFVLRTLIFSALLAMSAAADQNIPHQSGGGPLSTPTTECISAAQRNQINFNIAKSRFQLRGPNPLIAPYPFIPIAGTVWQDRFINNFVDLNTSSGILDWDCTNWTYDNHAGHDILLRSFGEQDVGVPVFAALDGVVTDSHDGEPDRNTSTEGQPANYVVLSHGGTHYTWYFHLRNGSVAVTNNQFVRAGTQIGLAASSGNSTAPHLHFESRYNGTYYEPSAGPCRLGDSYWVHQSPVRRDLYIEEFAMHNTNAMPFEAFLPFNPTRTGTFVRTGSLLTIGAWYVIHNLPASSTWRLRYIRPNRSIFYDSGAQPYNNSAARYGAWWVWYGLSPDTAGAWTLEMSVNGQVIVQAPFTVLNAGGVPTNRPPAAVTASFDPPAPSTNDVIFCRLTVPLTVDPDYDLMRFRYQWKLNGQPLRDVTNAAFADAVPSGSVTPGALLSCTVTPFDGQAFGPSTAIQVSIGGGVPPRVSLTLIREGPDQISLRWPVSQFNYVLETTTNVFKSWTVFNSTPTNNGSEYVVTTPVPVAPRFFRLRWP